VIERGKVTAMFMSLRADASSSRPAAREHRLHRVIGLGVAVLLSACGGTTNHGGGETEPPAPVVEVVELLSFESGAVTSIAINDGGIYYAQQFAPGVFGIDRDGTNVRRLAEDPGPEALTASGDELFWLSYSDPERGITQISGARDDGSARRDFVAATSTELGLQSPSWNVPVDADWVYWHQGDSSSNVTRFVRKPRSNGDEEQLFRLDSVVGNSWRLGNFLYWSDNDGISRFDLETKSKELLDAHGYYVDALVVIESDVYFLGFARADEAREGLFRVRAGSTRLVWPAELAKNRSRLLVDGSELYVFDNRGAGGVAITRMDDDAEKPVVVRTLGEQLSSNVVMDGEDFVLATDKHLLRVSKKRAD
jgi:hypothetical protein